MVLDFITTLTASEDVDPGSNKYINGYQSWLFYLFGAIFIVLGLISLWYTWRVRNSKAEYENIAVSYSWFKRFWYENRFVIMILITIICFAIAIAFFTLNNYITPVSS